MAFPFPMNLDLAFALSVLAGLSEGESDGEHFSEDDSDDEDEVDEGAYPLNTQEGMIRRFKTMRARFVQPGGIFGEQIFAGNVNVRSFTINETKPDSDMKPLQSLKPMTAKELELGTTHRGRYLCGWVAVDDAFFGIASTSLILEDVTGYLVEIAAYGLVDPDLPPHERQCILSRQFPKGPAYNRDRAILQGADGWI
ncbi:hypothetical protein PF005_g19449 [Phytophthora fragariae]|uniref:Uncharacterized protein n=2 Tax=Phytophthora TaxID=4783 RepID=A0A6A3SL43_9STRA|nr:hypothetical protein PF003_g36405 [Phytophthora fragariae]KAE8990499.1 hypothetical protein PR002_g21136 [Phytophthora rubi]KAE8929450.1 hypothetical protein PF009_g20430 [Phytophthora fragariae]KAE8990157.1 hypothetical protein PF011_g18467 [Phytophthora fragariae]KAE8993740.1 hypothetical protein PR001_g20588 [Phytophthora rubi]